MLETEELGDAAGEVAFDFGERAVGINDSPDRFDEAEALIALAEGFSLSAREGRERMVRIAESLAPWQESARANGIAQREISMMAESVRPRLEAVVTAAR